ncbi:MAG: TetR/AcrR family transcriptional regulator [Haliea sp.]|uniref:TetR/AcrR family transcriptional regulator n=1 Tax=Haliea sp. TaxID=1932666 RepID=UPI0032EC0267
MTYADNRLQATRREPKQARSRLLVASIREACRRIIQDNSADSLTAQRIADVAGVTIGSFYQYYPNKEAVLLDVLLEDAPEEADQLASETRYLGALRWQSLEDTLRELVVVTCERHRRLLQRHGEIYRRYHREIGFDTLIQASVRRYAPTSSLQEWLRETLLHHRPELPTASATFRAFLIATTLTEASARAVDEQPEWLGSATFRAELQQMLLAHALQAAAPADSATRHLPQKDPDNELPE